MASRLLSLGTGAGDGSSENLESVRRFAWEIRSINLCLDDFRHAQAKALGISGPQLMILMAVTDLERKKGVPVKVVAKLMNVDPSFVATQSKVLENKGFLRRKSCTMDARVMHLSLSGKATKSLANIAEQQKEIDKFVFGDLWGGELDKLAGGLAELRQRLEKARVKVALEF